MPLFTWNRSFSVGVERCDREHRRLFALLNELHAAMQAGKGNDVLARIFDELQRYTAIHFAAEEELMRLAAYPGLEAHRAEHERFITSLADVRKQMAGGRLHQSIAVARFLGERLRSHIQKTDRLFAAHLNAAGIV